MERVEVVTPGHDHSVTIGYYGGPLDGRSQHLRVMDEIELNWFDRAAGMHDLPYTVTRYGVHADNCTLCWALLTYTPIAERGKL